MHCKNCEKLAEIAIKKEKELTHCYKALEEIEKQSRINCEEICGRNYDTCKDKDCLTKQIINIIDKVKVKEDKL